MSHKIFTEAYIKEKYQQLQKLNEEKMKLIKSKKRQLRQLTEQQYQKYKSILFNSPPKGEAKNASAEQGHSQGHADTGCHLNKVSPGTHLSPPQFPYQQFMSFSSEYQSPKYGTIISRSSTKTGQKPIHPEQRAYRGNPQRKDDYSQQFPEELVQEQSNFHNYGVNYSAANTYPQQQSPNFL